MKSQPELVGKTCRTDRYTMAYQLQQFGGSLQFVAQFDPNVTPFRLAILKQLREDVACVVPPDSMRPIPEISEQISMGDLIIACEMIRATLVAALDPDEQEENSKLNSAQVLAQAGNAGNAANHIGFRRAAELQHQVNVPVR